MAHESKGEKRPIVKNDTDAGKRKNRRVEVIIE
jgi:outer membrane protein OmpA-like peptidoglycan-associated protein